MADSNDTAAKSTAKETQDALEKQIAQMKREIGKINKALAERAEDVVEDVVDQANGWYGSATQRASRATQALRSQASSVSETVKDNPGTVSSAMLVGGLIGFMLGMVIGQASDGNRHRWH